MFVSLSHTATVYYEDDSHAKVTIVASADFSNLSDMQKHVENLSEQCIKSLFFENVGDKDV